MAAFRVGADKKITQRKSDAVAIVKKYVINPKLRVAIDAGLCFNVTSDASTTKNKNARELLLVSVKAAGWDAPLRLGALSRSRAYNAKRLLQDIQAACIQEGRFTEDEFKKLVTTFSSDNAAYCIKAARLAGMRFLGDGPHSAGRMVLAALIGMILKSPVMLARKIFGSNKAVVKFVERAFAIPAGLFAKPMTRWDEIPYTVAVWSRPEVYGRLQQAAIFMLGDKLVLSEAADAISAEVADSGVDGASDDGAGSARTAPASWEVIDDSGGESSASVDHVGNERTISAAKKAETTRIANLNAFVNLTAQPQTYGVLVGAAIIMEPIGRVIHAMQTEGFTRSVIATLKVVEQHITYMSVLNAARTALLEPAVSAIMSVVEQPSDRKIKLYAEVRARSFTSFTALSPYLLLYPSGAGQYR
jgi:hypothetical protein